MKLFIVGLPKSGTSTIHKAIDCSGMRSVHWKSYSQGLFVGPSIKARYDDGEDPLTDWQGFDAITQADYIDDRVSIWPQMEPEMLAAIRRHHPGCRFLLNYRDPEAVVASVMQWGDLRYRLSKLGAPGLPPGAAETDNGLLEWIEKHYRQVRARHANDPLFCEIDIAASDARKRLGDFIGLPIEWWGVENRATKPEGQIRPSLRQRLISMFQTHLHR